MTDSQDKDKSIEEDVTAPEPEPEEETPRPRRSGKVEPTPEMPSGWRASRRGSKAYKKARKDIKVHEEKERMATVARKTKRSFRDFFYFTGRGIIAVAGVLLVIVLLFTGINGLARWNAERIAEDANSPEALLEKAKDNLLFIAEEDGTATGFLAARVDGENATVYGIAIPDGAFMEVPGQGFERIGDSYDTGPDTSLASVSNFFTVPFNTYATISVDAYQNALTEQSLEGIMDEVIDTNLSTKEVERWNTVLGEIESANVALVPMPVRPINVGSQTYFEPQRDEVSDLIMQWWGVAIGGESQTLRVIVYNGAGEAGIAGVAAQALIQGGLRVVDTKNADNFDYETTQVIVQSGDDSDGDAVIEVLGVGEIVSQNADQDIADVIVIIGKDFVGPKTK